MKVSTISSYQSNSQNLQGFSHGNKPAQPAFEGGGVLKGIFIALTALGITASGAAQSTVKPAEKVVVNASDSIAASITGRLVAAESKIASGTAEIASGTAKIEAGRKQIAEAEAAIAKAEADAEAAKAKAAQEAEAAKAKAAQEAEAAKAAKAKAVEEAEALLKELGL